MSRVDSLLVFDIETYSRPAAQHDPKILDALTKSCRDEAERQDTLSKLGLHPMTGEVACIGLFDPIRARPAIFYRQDLGKFEALQAVTWENQSLEVTLQARADEKELLTSIWDVFRRYDCLVTFNGRTFDYPFLMQRSFLLGVEVKHHLYANRYQVSNHLDLCDYMSGFGTARRYSLDVWGRASGLGSPKDGGVDGSRVSEFIDAGKIAEVADYCMRDVMVTAALAKRAFSIFPTGLVDFASFK